MRWVCKIVKLKLKVGILGAEPWYGRHENERLKKGWG